MTCTCEQLATGHRCVICGLSVETKPEPTLIDWLGSTKMQRRLSAGTWGADHSSRMRFPTDEKQYEPASRPIIPMSISWYKTKKDTST